MFQKLRLKLTLVNVAIILALFLLLIVGVYHFSRMEMTRHSDTMAHKIVADIQAGVITDLPRNRYPTESPPGPIARPPDSLPAPPPGPNAPPDRLTAAPPGPGFFFVKTSPAGAITFQSSEQPLTAAHLEALTEKALQRKEEQGTIDLGQAEYAYLKAPLQTPAGTIVLFRDLSQETNMMQTVLTALVGVGIICSLLSFGASYYMANRAMIPVQRAWRQQKDFLSDASHELRTPLTVFQTNLEVIRDSPDETVSSQSKWLNNIQEVSVGMAKLIDSLFFLAQADSQQQLLNKEPFSFNTVLEQAVTPFEAVAAAKAVSLRVRVEEFIKGYGDPIRIKQVIGILLDNAIRHTPAGGEVTVSLSQADAVILLTVADSGEGIETEYLCRIFDRFYQIDKSRNKGNSGLGLAIAKWIVENHGGDIAVDSVPGAGAIFTVRFPFGVN